MERDKKRIANSRLSDVVSLNLTKTYDLNIVELFLYITLLTKLTNYKHRCRGYKAGKGQRKEE